MGYAAGSHGDTITQSDVAAHRDARGNGNGGADMDAYDNSSPYNPDAYRDAPGGYTNRYNCAFDYALADMGAAADGKLDIYALADAARDPDANRQAYLDSCAHTDALHG